MWLHSAGGSVGLEGHLRIASLTWLAAHAGGQVGDSCFSVWPLLFHRTGQATFQSDPRQYSKMVKVEAAMTGLGSYTLSLLLNPTGQSKSWAT